MFWNRKDINEKTVSLMRHDVSARVTCADAEAVIMHYTLITGLPIQHRVRIITLNVSTVNSVRLQIVEDVWGGIQ